MRARMFAGILNKTLEVYRSTMVKNDFGEEVETYTLNGKYRCGVSHQTTSRTVMNSEVQYPYTKYFIVREYVSILEFDLIKYDGKYYRVTYIETNDELHNKRVDVESLNSDVNISVPTTQNG